LCAAGRSVVLLGARVLCVARCSLLTCWEQGYYVLLGAVLSGKSTNCTKHKTTTVEKIINWSWETINWNFDRFHKTLQKQCANQYEGKKRSRTPRFILVQCSSRATSSLFANKQRISLKYHQDNPIHYNYTCTKQETTTHYNRQPLHPIDVVEQCRTLLHSYKLQTLCNLKHNHKITKRKTYATYNQNHSKIQG